MVNRAASAPHRASAIELFDPMCAAVLREPHESYRLLRDRCPVAYLEPLDVWVVSRYADARTVLAAPQSFSAALAFGKDAAVTDSRSLPARRLNLRFAGDAGAVISSSDGATHARLRRAVAALLSRPRLDEADELVGRQVSLLISGLAERADEFDLVGQLAKPVAAGAIGRLMGLTDALAATLASWADTTFRALDPGDELSTLDQGPQVMRGNLACTRAVTAYLNDAVENTPPPTRAGLIATWAEADTPAAREEVILTVLQLFQAGYETIVSAICSMTAMFLADRPRSAEAFPPAGSGAFVALIEEGLRLASPVRATFRTALGPQRIAEVNLPDRARVMVLLGSANRDERAFEQPDEARPGRSNAHLAFGAGPHRCLGRFLAHMELKHVMGALASSTRSIAVAEGARLSANILKAGYEYLPVRVEWRRS